MHLRCLLAAAGTAAALALAPATATAQNEAPFTIRYPPDGATVREKVRIQVPLASIPENGYVQISINGQFRAALSPTAEQRATLKKLAAQKKTAAKPNPRTAPTFDYVWDTKAPYKLTTADKEQTQADGPAEVTLRLYVPNAGLTGGAALRQTSSVRVTVANKIAADPGPLTLRYRFFDGATSTYARSGVTTLVGGLSQGTGTSGDQELVGQTSKLQLSVDDIYTTGEAIVRNRIMQMTVRQGGQLSVYPEDQLPGSVYQQVTPRGKVTYQNRSMSFEQFAALGLPVSATIDLPVLPTTPVRVGDTWQTKGAVLSIPSSLPASALPDAGGANLSAYGQAFTQGGMPGAGYGGTGFGGMYGGLQSGMQAGLEDPDNPFAKFEKPKVTITSKLEGLEWEGGYPTAHIVETYDGTSGSSKFGAVVFGNTFVQNPQITYRRDIYLAFKSGTLVKTVQKLEVSGRSPQFASTPTYGYGATGYAPSMGRTGGEYGGTGSTFGRGGMMGGGRRSSEDEDYEGNAAGRPRGAVFGGIGSRGAAGMGQRTTGQAYSTNRAGRRTGTGYRAPTTTRSPYGATGYGTGAYGSQATAAPMTSSTGAPGAITGSSGQVTLRTTTTTELDRGKSSVLSLAY